MKLNNKYHGLVKKNFRRNKMSNFLVIKTSFNRFFKMLDQKTLPRLSTLIIINTYHRKSNNRMDIYTSSLTAIDIGILFQGRGKYTCLHCDVMRCATRTVHKRKTASRSSCAISAMHRARLRNNYER